MFISSYKLRRWLKWPPIRAHLCTLAVALSFSSTWQIPRHAFRFGGLMYGLILSIALLIVGLPASMLQLAIGQLSQQDAVGVWRAVPFFKGIGYLRLLISLLALMYTSVYVALIVTYFLYSISNSIPFWECQHEFLVSEDNDSNVTNITPCLNETFLAPVGEKPEYYIAMALIIIVLATLLPFVLLSPFKFLKRILYVLGPVVFTMGVIILSCIGDGSNLTTFFDREDIRNFISPNIWQRAVLQSLICTQTYNGFLILAGDTIYANTDVQWTAVVLVGANIVACWSGLVFWYCISSSLDRDVSSVAVLVETYVAAVQGELSVVWPLIIFIMLFVSGVVTMLIMFNPIYEHFRRIGGTKWRYFAIGGTVAIAAGAMGVLAGGLPALTAIEDVAVPLLISMATVAEVLVFLLIYGRKTLIDDVEFLLGKPMMKYWLVGWYATPCVIIPLTIWWIINLLINEMKWTESPLEAIMLVVAAGVGFIIFIVFAVAAVAKQVQYGTLAKLQSSFKPSRHWGPRDPITHYYWLAHREETERNLPRSIYRRRLGQLSGNTSFVNVSIQDEPKDMDSVSKKRSHSDDWLYTIYRKKYLEEISRSSERSKKRSKSLDWAIFLKKSIAANLDEKTVIK
ncbi:sodium-dependent nutrient amino acid transporter 1-like [Battus philenor]|uniref:sodium-dependent nutrient amino acid transporter 1-like n=1 Tax=Battus philenor TaxID=42288 RepID=UPI0035CFE590